jgi:hypothetical protein
MRAGRRRLLVLAAAAAAAPLLLAPASAAEPSSTAITVAITDRAIRLSKRAAPAGKVTFVVRNRGRQAHDFRIASRKTPVLRPGRTARLVVTFRKPGRFPYASTRPGDARRGLRGTFAVTAPRARGTKPGAGKSLFSATGCGGCHVFAAGGGVGAVGPNLDTSRLKLAAVVRTISNGKGAMPPYREQLSPGQIQELASFLVQARAG